MLCRTSSGHEPRLLTVAKNPGVANDRRMTCRTLSGHEAKLLTVAKNPGVANDRAVL